MGNCMNVEVRATQPTEGNVKCENVRSSISVSTIADTPRREHEDSGAIQNSQDNSIKVHRISPTNDVVSLRSIAMPPVSLVLTDEPGNPGEFSPTPSSTKPTLRTARQQRSVAFADEATVISTPSHSKTVGGVEVNEEASKTLASTLRSTQFTALAEWRHSAAEFAKICQEYNLNWTISKTTEEMVWESSCPAPAKVSLLSVLSKRSQYAAQIFHCEEQLRQNTPEISREQSLTPRVSASVPPHLTAKRMYISDDVWRRRSGTPKNTSTPRNSSTTRSPDADNDASSCTTASSGNLDRVKSLTASRRVPIPRRSCVVSA